LARGGGRNVRSTRRWGTEWFSGSETKSDPKPGGSANSVCRETTPTPSKFLRRIRILLGAVGGNYFAD